jgi:hypothetical protein
VVGPGKLHYFFFTFKIKIFRRQTCIAFGFIVIAAIFFLVTIHFIKAKDKDRIECAVEYLKTEFKSNDESFNAVGDFSKNYEQCKEFLEENFNKILDETRERINTKTGLRQYTNCVINQLRNHEPYKEKILLAQVADYSKISWMFWEFFARRSHLNQIQLELEIIEDSEINYCRQNSKNFQSEGNHVSTSTPDHSVNEDGSGYEDDNDYEYAANEETRKRRDVSHVSKSLLHREDDFFFHI